jgi:hypothetical protein
LCDVFGAQQSYKAIFKEVFPLEITRPSMTMASLKDQHAVSTLVYLPRSAYGSGKLTAHLMAGGLSSLAFLGAIAMMDEAIAEVARLKMPDPYELHSKRPDPLISKDLIAALPAAEVTGNGVEVRQAFDLVRAQYPQLSTNGV